MTAMALALDAKAEWKSDALAWLAEQPRGTVVTADDLRNALREPPHPAQVGGAFSAARARGLIARGHYRASTIRTRNAGGNFEWTRL